MRWLLFLAFASIPSFATVIKVGEVVPDMCWWDPSSRSACLGDYSGDVRVLVYSTGWCPACNDEMGELARRAGEIAGLPVTVFSLSAQGWQHGSLPTRTFLKEWRDKHRIPFLVLASPKDAGKAFFDAPISIPNVAIVGRDGKLKFKELGPSVNKVFAKVRELARE